MKKITEYEVQDVYCTVDEKLDLKDDEHYLYKTVCKTKEGSGWLIPTKQKFVKVVNDNWLKHHKTYYNHDVIDNTETTTNRFGYYNFMDNYHCENKFRTDLYDKKITIANTTKVLTNYGVPNLYGVTTLTNEQLKNPSYEGE